MYYNILFLCLDFNKIKAKMSVGVMKYARMARSIALDSKMGYRLGALLFVDFRRVISTSANKYGTRLSCSGRDVYDVPCHHAESACISNVVLPQSKKGLS